MARKAGIRSYETLLILISLRTKSEHLFGVVKNDADGMAMPGTNSAHAMSKIHSLKATCSLHGAMMPRKGSGVPLA